jgi:hypothetical protein
MKLQLPSSVLMIRPNYFGYNQGTAHSNSFQQQIHSMSPEEIRSAAIEEFDSSVSLLEAWDIEVMTFEDSPNPFKPDAVFPNNWISTHYNGWLLSYPMMDPSRRLEQRDDIINALVEKYGYVHRNDLKKLEAENIFLEGTGSLVLDREHKLAYAALSPRTHPLALQAWSQLTGFKYLSFHTEDLKGKSIYHTNVMMSIAGDYVLIGSDCIAEQDRNKVIESLENHNKKILHLSNEQVLVHFAANVLGLQNRDGEKLLVMSTTAKKSLSDMQLDTINKWGFQILAAPLNTIETVGGGSARCMMAEIVKPL